jgi:hypothetical protein
MKFLKGTTNGRGGVFYSENKFTERCSQKYGTGIFLTAYKNKKRQ